MRRRERPRSAAGIVLAGSAAFVGYTFAGYPLLMALAARLRPRPVAADPAHLPSVCLVVAAFNEQDVIERKLADTLALDYPPERLQVVVAADGSDDATVERAGRFERVTVLHEPRRRGKLAALNRAFDATSSDVVVFTDANNRYTPTALRELVAPFADPAVGVVTGRKAIDDGSGRPLDRAEGLYWRYESKLKSWESATGSVTTGAGEILAFRREAYTRPPPGTLTEDLAQVLLAAAAGWRVVYVPQAVSLERASRTLGDEAARRSRLVAGRWQAVWRLMPRLLLRRPGLAWQLASHKASRPLVPWALLAVAGSSARLAARTGWARALVVAQAAFYGAALAGWRADRRGRRGRLTYLPFYFCRMNVAAADGLRSILSGGHGGMWDRVARG
jgi:cellulose synthase/poly-beta-1,6-N-acetylglucosamine synthase-like glycosyltransferase